MADSVTISTYLELQDHMSGGINRVVEELKRLNTTAEQMNGKMRAAGAAQQQFANKAVSGADRAKRALQGLKDVADGLASPLMAAASAIGGLAAIKTAIGLGRDFENVSIRIAGTIKAFNLAPTFKMATDQAQSVIGTIQDLAAALPGETEDYITVFAQALPKSIAAGLTDVRKVADFTSRYTAVAISNTVDAQQAGMDLFRMLAGQAGADVRMWTVLAEKIGMDAKAFNKLAANVRQSKIDEAIRAFDDQLKAAGNTFDAKFGEMQSRLKEIVRLGSAPLFEGVKTVLAEINKYLTDNKEQLMATVQVIARDFLAGIRKLPAIISEIGARLEEIWGYTKLIAGVWAGLQLLNGLSAVLSIYTKIRDMAVAISAANAAGGLAGGAGALATKLSVGQLVLAGATTVVLAAGVAKMFAESVGASAKAGAGMRAGFWGTAGWEEEQFRTGRTGAAKAVSTMAEFDAKARSSARESLVFSGKYAGLQAQLDAARYGSLATYERESGLAGAISELDALRSMYKQAIFSPMKTAVEDTLKFAESLGVSKETLEDLGIKASSVATAAATVKSAPSARPQQTFDFRNSRFDIKQEFAEGFDPDRIAVAFANDLGRLGDMKLQAAYGQVGMVR